jgi:hypothetical protein
VVLCHPRLRRRRCRAGLGWRRWPLAWSAVSSKAARGLGRLVDAPVSVLPNAVAIGRSGDDRDGQSAMQLTARSGSRGRTQSANQPLAVLGPCDLGGRVPVRARGRPRARACASPDDLSLMIPPARLAPSKGGAGSSSVRPM